MSDYPDWLSAAIDHLRSAPSDLTPEQWAARIHEALEIVEVKKYATPESRFAFKFTGASEQDLVEIRKHLSEFENSIVEMERKEMPALDRDGLKRLREWIVLCPECRNFELKNYCRECDEFFTYGHDKNCKLNPHQHEEHERHRTY